jgi:branched-chain amino acid transport system substrate-binding protein
MPGKHKLLAFIVAIFAFFILDLESSQAKNTINIGVILPLSGPIENFGKSAHSVLNHFVEVYNRKYGSFKINLIIEDSASDPRRALSVAKKLIALSDVSAIIGPIFLGSSMAAARSVHNKVPIISLSYAATSKQIDDYKCIFTVAPSIEPWSLALAKSLKNNKVNSASVLCSESYNMLLETTMAPLRNTNIEISKISKFKPNAPEELKNAILESNLPTQSNVIILGDQPRKSLGAWNWQPNSPKMIFILQYLYMPLGTSLRFPMFPTATNIITIKPRAMMPALIDESSEQRKLLIQIKEIHRRALGMKAVGLLGASAHDALAILFNSIDNVGSQPNNIIDYIEKMRGFKGALGTYSFSRQNHIGLDSSAFIATMVNHSTRCDDDQKDNPNPPPECIDK